MGGWVQRDPVGGVGASSLYQYVSSNPLNRVDPLGLVEQCPGWPKIVDLVTIGSEAFFEKYVKHDGWSVSTPSTAIPGRLPRRAWVKIPIPMLMPFCCIYKWSGCVRANFWPLKEKQGQRLGEKFNTLAIQHELTVFDKFKDIYERPFVLCGIRTERQIDDLLGDEYDARWNEFQKWIKTVNHPRDHPPMRRELESIMKGIGENPNDIAWGSPQDLFLDQLEQGYYDSLFPF